MGDQQTLVAHCREARDLESRLRGLANAFDRGGDVSGEAELRAKLATAQRAALDAAQQFTRENGDAWLEELEKRLSLLVTRPGSERLTASVALARLRPLLDGGADASFAAAYADAMELLYQHRRLLDAALSVKKR